MWSWDRLDFFPLAVNQTQSNLSPTEGGRFRRPSITRDWTTFVCGSPAMATGLWLINSELEWEKRRINLPSQFYSVYRICWNKHPGRLIFRSNINISKTHQKPSVCVLPPLKYHPSKDIGFVYSPLWKITVFGGRLFRVSAYFEVDVYFGKYGIHVPTTLDVIILTRKEQAARREIFKIFWFRQFSELFFGESIVRVQKS